ncbi:MAG: CAP domain-containing protein [Bacteroidetes bacterium]|nr:CAP domain-containing protein [Bacteroidota bacterium]
MTRKNFRDLLILACVLIVNSLISGLVSGQMVSRQGPAVPANFCIHPVEMDLYHMINEYRKQQGLAPIPLSKSLSRVAALHAKDLFLNHPDQGACNFHSWSGKGSWTPFCYPKDETKKSSVWDKPRELTRYPSKAYEIVYWENNPLIRDTIIMVWKTEAYFNNFLLNTGKWAGKTWNALGIAVYENYACAWFGEVPDPEGETYVCGSPPVKQVNDTVKPAIKPVIPPPLKPKKPKPGKAILLKGDSLAKKAPDTLTAKFADSVPERKVTPALPKDSATATYFIIVKTNLSREAADKLVGVLRLGEYPGAMVQEKDGKLRVSVFESPDKTLVMTKLKEVKKTYRDAWLLKR